MGQENANAFNLIESQGAREHSSRKIAELCVGRERERYVNVPEERWKLELYQPSMEAFGEGERLQQRASERARREEEETRTRPRFVS